MGKGKSSSCDSTTACYLTWGSSGALVAIGSLVFHMVQSFTQENEQVVTQAAERIQQADQEKKKEVKKQKDEILTVRNFSCRLMIELHL